MPRYFAPEERYNKFKQWREQRNLDAAGQGPQAPADPVWQSVARNVGTGPAPVLPPAPQPVPMPPPQLSVPEDWQGPLRQSVSEMRPPQITPPVIDSMGVSGPPRKPLWFLSADNPRDLPGVQGATDWMGDAWQAVASRLPRPQPVPEESLPTAPPEMPAGVWPPVQQYPAPQPVVPPSSQPQPPSLPPTPVELTGQALDWGVRNVDRPSLELLQRSSENAGGPRSLREPFAATRATIAPGAANILPTAIAGIADAGGVAPWFRGLQEGWENRKEDYPGQKGLAELLGPSQLALNAVGPGEIGAAGKAIGGAAKKSARAVDRAVTSPEGQAIARRLLPAGTIEDVSKAAPDAKRYYHGTGSAFDVPDAAKFDPNGLYGPGYYMTDAPEVAGSYAASRTGTPHYANDVLAARRNAVKVRQEQYDTMTQVNPDLSPAIKDSLLRSIEGAKADLAEAENMFTGTGQNVRAIDVPENLRLLDVEAPLTPETIQRVISTVRDTGGDGVANALLSDLQKYPPSTGANLYDSVREIFGGNVGAAGHGIAQQKANSVLQSLGYDGISYAGGKRVPLLDANGKPIEHTALVIFPESLPKIKNAISGTLMGTPPEIGGAVAGGAYGAAQPAESEQERAQNIIKGAAGGALVGSGARAAGKVLASRGAKGPFGERLGIADDAGKAVPEGAPKKKLPPEIEQPLEQGVQQELQGQGQPGTPPISVEDITKSANAANRTLGEMYAKPTGSAAPGIIERMEGVRRAIVRAATDEGVDLAKFQQQAAKAKGAPLSADEMAYELKRLNPDKAAQVALDEKLRPVVQGIGQDQPWLSVYLTHQDNIDVAKAMGNQARKFSGGLSVADSRQALQDMATELGPERFQAVQQAAQQVQDFGRQLLARKRDAGLITDQLYKDLTDMYPHYVPTRITDYMKDPMNIPVGKSLSVRDTGLRRNTVEGTIRAREDPLASMVRNAYETEALARKNETFNAFVKLSQMDPELQAMVRKVPDSYTTTRAEAKVTGFVNGVRETYVVPKALEYVIKSEAKALIPGFAGDVWGAMMSAFRAGATSRNPVFLASNATLDAATYGVRESSRAGGPQALPKIITELVGAYGDAFQGVLSGTYHGDTAEFLRAGGGQFGFFQGTPGKARATLQDLKRANVFTVNGLGDIGRLTKDMLTLKPVEGLGERIELAPRVASYRLAQKAGKNATQAVINGRTVTMDFSQGGTVSKVINGFIPFFNVGMQAFPQVVRAAKENPRGFLATTAALLAGPTIAAEAWNRSDPQRAKDYEDVPQYLKDQGVVIMLPQPAPTGTQGDRRPQFVQIRLREFAPFAIVAREAAGRVMGEDPRSWGDLIMSSIGAESPIQGNNPADALSSFSPLGVSTALQLALNKDLFRNRMIDTKGANERASAVGKTVGGALGVSPSQVDFTVRDLASGVGGTALAAGDLVAGKAPRSSAPQDMPVVGGVYGRFVKGNTGDRLDKARQNLLTPEAKEILKAAGVDLPLQPVGYTINNVPLMMNEEEKYQVLTNRYIDEAIRTAANLPRWGEYSADLRAKAIQSLVSGARERAGAEVLKGIGAEEMKRRLLAVKK